MLKQRPKQRADLLILARGLADSQGHAQALVMAGQVYSGTSRVSKPGDLLADDSPLEIRGQSHPFVSRGGLKLDHAIKHFDLPAQGRIALDIGSSTGGFTDVLLTQGAARVHAVDVGHGQLAWKLRQDPRVIVHERTNARHLTRQEIPDPIGIVVCDASFIGLRTILPAGLALCAPEAWAVALIKPQFEATRSEVGRHGVVRDPAVHQKIIGTIKEWWRGLPGWSVLGVTESPVQGPEGNKEFLIAAQYQAGSLSSSRSTASPMV
ncbi:MAG TPA: TlyA family RNA methyltransferase [Acetobacteraceae bacterium]|nr:TlyA family RNA methyltransferase [Acetobacteraceae bacterium]